MSEDVEVRSIDGKNHHACAIQVAGAGVLITGKSGSGKTSLAHGLIAHFYNKAENAHWVSDDQVCLSVANGTLWAKAPEPIAGKAELFGLGIVEVPFITGTGVDLVVSIKPDEAIERMPDDRFAAFCSPGSCREIRIPLLDVPERHEAQSIRLVVAKLAKLLKQGQSGQ